MTDQPDMIPRLPLGVLAGSFWAMRRDRLARLFELARTAAAMSPQPRAAVPAAQQPPDAAGVAVIPLTGILTPYGSFLSLLFGGGLGGVQGFRDDLAAAVADPSVGSIVLDVDSPGGIISLIPEAAADVQAAREQKPVYAVANVQAASAAYWIASQATELYVTPSGTVGSVGVFYVHEDYSARNEQMGVDVTYIYAGQYKTEGYPDQPLSDEAQAAWQADADTLYQQFVNAVATGRNVTPATVEANYGQGRVLLAQDALDAGMVDGIQTLQQVIARAFTAPPAAQGPSARRVGAVASFRDPIHPDAAREARRLLADRLLDLN